MRLARTDDRPRMFRVVTMPPIGYARSVVTRPQMKQAAEIVISRVVPGVLNLVALVVLAGWLSPQSYGLASTYIATATAAAGLLLGPVIQSILVHHSEHHARGEQARYESIHLANTCLVAAIIGLGGMALVWAGVMDWRIVAAVVAVGAYTSLLEISHARLQFYRYAVGSSSQSVLFLLLAFLVVRPDPTVSNVLEVFAVSYAVGALVSALLVTPRPALPNLSMLKEAFAIGTVPTLSNLAVSGFSLGCRYLLLLFGQREALGTLSFSLDIAQRGVGIFINFATFAIVPVALRSAQSGGARQLWLKLARGWVVAVLVSLLGAAAIMAAAATGQIGALNSAVYDPISFALISIAVIVNRSSKMVLSPVAMRLRRTAALLTPLLVISPAALAVTALGLYLQIPYVVEIVYTLAFVLWAAASYRSLSPRLREDSA